jgi:hypothetical protein
MSYTAILHIIATTCVVTIPIGMALPWIVRTLTGKLAQYARPRFLVSEGVRHRTQQAQPKP